MTHTFGRTSSPRRFVAALAALVAVSGSAPALAEEAGPQKLVVLPLTGPKGIAARDEIARRLEGRVELVVGSKSAAASRARTARREGATALVGGSVGCPGKTCRVQVVAYRSTGKVWERATERVPREEAVEQAGRIAEELLGRLGVLEEGGEAPVAAAPPSPAAPTPAPAAPPPTHEAVLAAVAALPGLTTWAVVPLAHFRRGDRHVVVAWPALNSRGEVVDATVVGIPLEVTSAGEIREAGRRWVIQDRARSVAALDASLGGADHEVMGRDAGAPLDRLGSELARLAAAFATAASSRDRAAAVAAAAAFAELLPVERAAHESSVAQLLWMAAAHGGRLEPVSTERHGDEATLTIRVLRGGIALRTIRATARPITPGVDRWVVVDYEE